MSDLFSILYADPNEGDAAMKSLVDLQVRAKSYLRIPAPSSKIATAVSTFISKIICLSLDLWWGSPSEASWGALLGSPHRVAGFYFANDHGVNAKKFYL